VSVVWYTLRSSRLKVQELVVAPEQVVRARIASDPPGRDVLIYDFEGEFFFGAAPDLEKHLQAATDEARKRHVHYLVLRLKRVRRPDAVALEALDVFLKEAHQQGLTVFLAGVRPDLLSALQRLAIASRHGENLIFAEQEKDYSATLAAVRKAYELAADTRSERPTNPPVYYLV